MRYMPEDIQRVPQFRYQWNSKIGSLFPMAEGQFKQKTASLGNIQIDKEIDWIQV
ncbi:hypothetical protein [Neobacillus muris]|uniref:hypothetical protein n=1 Tax=Neobacillus muris TaxID=2941334 RepID=UPI00203ED99F|nr:hypothetical protein [Neobacillus muris]